MSHGKRNETNKKRLDYLTGLSLNIQNMIRTINCLIIHAVGYKTNVCKLRKSDLDDLGMIVGSVLQSERFHGSQSSDKILYQKREEVGKRLKSF